MSTFEDLMCTLKGFTLVRPWAGERRKVGSSGFACYVLVPHHTGLSLDEVEKMLSDIGGNIIELSFAPPGLFGST